jgi:hypothetical protein
MPIRSPEWEINKICARFITNIAPCESLGSTGDPHFRYWPILLQNSLKVMSRSDSIMLMRIGGAGDDGPE